ncbi:hypothetical protein [Porphyromonas sp.]
MQGIKGEEEKAGKRRIAAGEEGLFRGEKGQFRPFAGVVKREKRGGKGAKKLYLIEA